MPNTRPGLVTTSKQFSETFKPDKRLLVANTSAIPLVAQPLSPKFRRPGEVGWPSLSCWGMLVLIMAPTMLVYAFLQQYLTKGITVGALKG